MYAIEALSEQGVWRALKRTLNHNRLEFSRLKFSIRSPPRREQSREINVEVI